MTTKQPEALRLADVFEKEGYAVFTNDMQKAAAELRRLHALNAELLAALKSERALRVIGQHPDVHWESLRDMRRSVYAATDAVIAKAEGREA